MPSPLIKLGPVPGAAQDDPAEPRAELARLTCSASVTIYDYIADLKINNNNDINNFHYILQSHSLLSKL